MSEQHRNNWRHQYQIVPRANGGGGISFQTYETLEQLEAVTGGPGDLALVGNYNDLYWWSERAAAWVCGWFSVWQ